ncbi:MAG TPA: hypothetical protein VNF73_05165 [Candidatus Saccharimonadales bacterium]|nr:hypothetical protein [Candidatus Saccharimonadales bacterium]
MNLDRPSPALRVPCADTFIKSIVERMDDNANIFRRILDDPAFQAVVLGHYVGRVFERARSRPRA